MFIGILQPFVFELIHKYVCNLDIFSVLNGIYDNNIWNDIGFISWQQFDSSYWEIKVRVFSLIWAPADTIQHETSTRKSFKKKKKKNLSALKASHLWIAYIA